MNSDFDDLEDLYLEATLAQAAKNPKVRRVADPGLRQSLDAAAKRMKELYTLPENWTRVRGVALIDKWSKSLVGNFSEYHHVSMAGTRKLIRETSLTSVEGVEEVEGYLGTELEMRLRGRVWEEQHRIVADLTLDEMLVSAPQVELDVYTHLGATVRVELLAETQFASNSGHTILRLPAGTDLWHQISTDSKIAVRKAIV